MADGYVENICCSLVPHDFLRKIAEQHDADDHVREAIRHTIEQGGKLKATRQAQNDHIRQARENRRQNRLNRQQYEEEQSTHQGHGKGHIVNPQQPGASTDTSPAPDPEAKEALVQQQKALLAASKVDIPAELQDPHAALTVLPEHIQNPTEDNMVHPAVTANATAIRAKQQGLAAADDDADYEGDNGDDDGALEKTWGVLKRYVYDNGGWGQSWNILGSNGQLVRKEGAVASTDATVNIVYDNLQLYWSFVKMLANYPLFDNSGTALNGVVHYGRHYMNANWNGTAMIYGDGDGVYYANFASSLDVTGHEMTHGLINFTSGLGYHNEPGALNEHFADVMGVLLVQYVKNQSFETTDWTIGRGVYKMSPFYMRSFSHPEAGAPAQPKHMKDYVHVADTYEGDWGAVHYNSGILNFVFYSLAKAAGGKTYQKLGPLWFYMMTDSGLHQDCSFKRFAAATEYYAEHMSLEALVPVIRKCWNDVGIADYDGMFD